MKRNRVSITEKRVAGIKKNQTSSQRKATLPNPKKMRKNISVNMVNTKDVKEHKVKEKAMEEPTVSVREIDLESVDGGGKENHGINTHSKCRRTRKENDRVLTN